ncbi:hypothetical protein GGR51DRAFT_556750 [Nemania sp. FL0031]|nr:hypothetical protein GGR51DRAFT_556750 [Nemania sp. FL0031]
MGGMQATVWYCCFCSLGPWNWNLDEYCQACQHHRCADCQLERTSADKSIFLEGGKSSVHPVRNTKEPHIESYSSQEQNSSQRRDSREEDSAPSESLLSEFPSSSTSFRFSHSSQPQNSEPSRKLPGTLHQQAAAQSTSRDPGIFAAYVPQSWRISQSSSTGQDGNPKNLIEGKVVVGKERDGRGVGKSERLHQERDGDSQIGNGKRSIGGKADLAGRSSLSPFETLDAGKGVPTQCEVEDAIPPEHDIYETNTSPAQENTLKANGSPEIGDRGRRLNAIGSGAKHEPREAQHESKYTTNQDKESADSLESLFNLLGLQEKSEYVNIILQVCDGIREYAVCDGGEDETEDSPTQSRGDNGQGSSRAPDKRLQLELEDSDSEQRGLKKRKRIRAKAVDVELNEVLACLFYKLNPYIYSACSHFKGLDISKIGHHLRTSHRGERSCAGCYKHFRDDQERDNHVTRRLCRSTRGPSVNDIKISKKQGISGKERWFDIWSQLFPCMKRPKDPWWSESLAQQQIILSVWRRLQDQDGTPLSHESVEYWSQRILSEWHRSPPEHLPDLLKESSAKEGNAGIRDAQAHSPEHVRSPSAGDLERTDIDSIPAPSSSQAQMTLTHRETTPSSPSNFDDDIESPLPGQNFEFSSVRTLAEFLATENNAPELDQSDQGATFTQGEISNWGGPQLVFDDDVGVSEFYAQRPNYTDPNYPDFNCIDPECIDPNCIGFMTRAYVDFNYIVPSVNDPLYADPNYVVAQGSGLQIGEEHFEGN